MFTIISFIFSKVTSTFSIFSEIKHNWEDAIAECVLYGGWLVDVKDQKEHNCLMRYGISQGYNAWFHTDGKTKNKKIHT